MALRIANKINRQIVKNISRSLSGKRDAELEQAVQKVEDIGKTGEPLAPPPTPVVPIKYEVCRPRTTPIDPFPNSVQNESDAIKQTVALQHLQPSMLPEYYKPPTEINSACMGFDPIGETSKYRKFEESNTFKNTTLPLKGPKLASPFPEPVKVMQSHTVSDREKAEQMLAESKTMLKPTSIASKPKQSSTRAVPPNVRGYSTNQSNNSKEKTCKLGGVKEVKRCAKIKVPHCAPVKNIRCEKKKAKKVECVRKPPPYPSYSETCHEDAINKPSECKICPYRADEHPHFKPPKSSFHTFSFQPNKENSSRISVNANIVKKKNSSEVIDGVLYFSSINLREDTPKQVPSTNTASQKFSTQAKEEQGKTQKKKGKVTAKIAKAPLPSSISLGMEMGSWLSQLKPEDVLLPIARMYEMNAAAGEKEGGRCKKFPFKECTVKIIKERKPTPKYNDKCPPKEKPKLVNDCPPDRDDDKCKRTSFPLNDIFSYIMSDKDKGDKGPKKKCPKINMGVCHDNSESINDPCGRRKRGKTLICPNDLLKKGPKGKKKKTSPMIPIIEKTPPIERIPTTVNV